MKKIALILDSLDKIFPKDGNIHGGANRVGKYLIEDFAKLQDVSLDIICGISNIEKPQNIHEIISFGFCPFSNMDLFFQKAEEIVKQNEYDVVLTNDLFPPFGNLIVHSHTIMYKNKNCKNFFEKIFLEFTRRKKTEKFKKLFENKNRTIFTVSNHLRQDYIQNLGFDEKNVICVYPGVEQKEKTTFMQNETFTFGIVAGNAINKGGYLFLLSTLLLKIMNKNFKAKMIVTKSNKPSAMGKFLQILNLKDKVEIMPEQTSMEDFYNQIDCLVVPSINETFALVVTEAASFGKPSLVSHTVGASEIITNGNNGFIFERKSSVLKSALNLYKKMSEILSFSKENFQEISSNAYFLSKYFLWENYSENITKALNIK